MRIFIKSSIFQTIQFHYNMNIQEIKTIKLQDFLASLGYSPTKQQGNNLWYLSPFRQENHASFKVNTGRNQWYDFGIGKGGNIIDLAELLYKSSDVPYLIRKIAYHAMTAFNVSWTMTVQGEMSICNYQWN